MRKKTIALLFLGLLMLNGCMMMPMMGEEGISMDDMSGMHNHDD